MNFYLIVNSGNSKEYFPSNKPYSFSVYLNKLFQLKNRWEVALTEVTTKQKFTEFSQLYICSNICEGTYIDGQLLPLLRCVVFDKDEIGVKTFGNPYYMPVIKQGMTSLSFYINDYKQELLSLLTQSLTLTLHFKQIE